MASRKSASAKAKGAAPKKKALAKKKAVAKKAPAKKKAAAKKAPAKKTPDASHNAQGKRQQDTQRAPQHTKKRNNLNGFQINK